MATGSSITEIPDEAAVSADPEGIPQHVARHVLSGTSTLGASVFVERGATFLANVLAARLAGASVFGAYSLGISTANNISTYAAGGIGATATRFSGKYPYEGGNYGTFAKALAVVSLVSAVVAALALSVGARPIAGLLHETRLTGLLHWAAISAAGMILLECVRGFFVGQRRLLALALLSLVVGISMLALLPAMAATHHATWMVISQGSVTLLAVGVCLALARPLGVLQRGKAGGTVRFGTMLREVWGYGFIQLTGLLSANLAGWWVTVLVARGDATLAQMGFFAIASQFRNLAGLIPGLLTEGSFAMMASSGDEASRMPNRLMAICTYASTAVSFVFAATVILVAPWMLHLFYGPGYRAAAVATAVGLAVAVLQMGNSPTSARLSIVSIRSTAVINTTWAVFTAIVGTLLMVHGGSAAEAMAVFFAAHVLMAGMVLGALRRRDWVPPGLVTLFVTSAMGILVLSLLAYARSLRPEMAGLLSGAMVLVAGGVVGVLALLGRRYRWFPPRAVVGGLVARARGAAPRWMRGRAR